MESALLATAANVRAGRAGRAGAVGGWTGAASAVRGWWLGTSAAARQVQDSRQACTGTVLRVLVTGQAVGPGGDTFDYQDNSPDNFYGTIGGDASRSGMIEVQIPSAATSSLYLLYRPQIAQETGLTRLKIG